MNTTGPTRPSRPSRVLIAEDNAIVRAGLIELIASEPGWEVAGHAVSLDALRAALTTLPDIDAVVLDLHLGHEEMAQHIPALRRLRPAARFVAISALSSGATNAAAGCDAFVAKADLADALLPALRPGARRENPDWVTLRAELYTDARESLAALEAMLDAADWRNAQAAAHRLLNAVDLLQWRDGRKHAEALQAAIVEHEPARARAIAQALLPLLSELNAG